MCVVCQFPISIPTFVWRGKIPKFPLQTEVRAGIGTGYKARGEGEEEGREGRGTEEGSHKGRASRHMNLFQLFQL